jgi:hypothetical protein
MTDKRKPKSLNDPRDVTIHEAGHAVIGRVLTLVCGGVSTEPDFETGEAGSAIIADHFACTYAWEKRGKVRTDDAVVDPPASRLVCRTVRTGAGGRDVEKL